MDSSNSKTLHSEAYSWLTDPKLGLTVGDIVTAYTVNGVLETYLVRHINHRAVTLGKYTDGPSHLIHNSNNHMSSIIPHQILRCASLVTPTAYPYAIGYKYPVMLEVLATF